MLSLLDDLSGTPVASHDEVLRLAEAHHLHGIGLSLVGAHLLAGLRLSDGDALWTRDIRLASAARQLGVVAEMTG